MNLLSERLEYIYREMPELEGERGQTGLVKASGASKSVVNQWLVGKIKSMDIRYALNIERELGFSHIWLMTGDGDPHDAPLYRKLAQAKTEQEITGEAAGPIHEQMERLYQAARELGGSVGLSSVASALGQTVETLKSWEARGVSKMGALKAQTIFGCSANWILTGEGSMRPEGSREIVVDQPSAPSIPTLRVVSAEAPATVPIRLVQIKLRAGITGVETEFEPDDGGIFEVPVDVIERLGVEPQYLFATRAKGSSMEPMMFDGELAVFNRKNVQLKSGGVYALNFNNEGMIKQLVQRGSEWYLHSFNSECPDRNVRSGECHIVGSLVWQPPRLVTHQFG